MKRFLAALLAALTVFTLTGCGKTENPVHSNQVANFFRNVDFHGIEETALSTLEGDRVRCASRQISTFH